MSHSSGADVLLLVTGLTKCFGPRRSVVLDNISFHLGEGEGMVVRGRSGSGKTTLLHMIAGLEHPSAGDVFFEGLALSRISDSRMAGLRGGGIGCCFQGPAALRHLTDLENAALPLILLGRSVPVSLKKAGELLECLGLAEHARSFPSSLSGGQLQRLSLARALVTRPRLVLADEPTGNLDSETARDVLDILMRFHLEQRAALILVTHDILPESLGLPEFMLSSGKLCPVSRNQATPPRPAS